jgi:Fe-Mn family superoxide dismutase
LHYQIEGILMDIQSVKANTLLALPYSFDVLEPYIDAQTMQIHYEKHHAGYVDNLIKTLALFPGLENKPVVEILGDLHSFPESVRTPIKNFGGGHLNHTMFWTMMKKGGGGEPVGTVATAMKTQFQSFAAFQEQFNTTAKSVFGSGWAWLCVDKNGELVIVSTPNQDAPMLQGLQPILGLDVWEHAYYLKYQNRRPSYIDAFWHVVDWHQVEENYRQVIR